MGGFGPDLRHIDITAGTRRLALKTVARGPAARWPALDSPILFAVFGEKQSTQDLPTGARASKVTAIHLVSAKAMRPVGQAWAGKAEQETHDGNAGHARL